MWHLVTPLGEQWQAYLRCVWERLIAVPEADAFQVAKELKKSVEGFYYSVRGSEADMSFYYALLLLHDSDWEAISYFLVPAEKPKPF